ncbi:MAG: hypothetical protein C0391_01480 [Anaerolinea sp.]|nr:hypothetical protein [Anaerolinea sp.]
MQAMNWDYVGNPWAVEMLRTQIVQDTTRHAYIFAGPQGIGRRTLALRFVQALNCPQAAVSAEPCLSCRVCQQIETTQYSDLQVLELLEGKSEISREQVRLTQQFLSLTPYQSKSKVAIFRDFQLASAGTQDALLKTLEETPGSARIFITVDALENLLPTTVSRCEVLSLRPMPAEELANTLHARLHVEPEKARLLGHISGGRYGYARLLAEDESLLQKRATWLDEWSALAGMNRLQRFKYVEAGFPKRSKLTLKEKRQELAEMLNTWMSFNRDVLLLVSGAGSGLMNIDRSGEVERVSVQTTTFEAARTIRCLERAINRVERYLNPRLVMETLMLELEGAT